MSSRRLQGHRFLNRNCYCYLELQVNSDLNSSFQSHLENILFLFNVLLPNFNIRRNGYVGLTEQEIRNDAEGRTANRERNQNFLELDGMPVFQSK